MGKKVMKSGKSLLITEIRTAITFAVFRDCTETSEFKWTYYPPQRFKILVYFPETDSFAVSGIYERYAFDSYYKVDAGDIELKPSSTYEGLVAVKATILLKKSYP